ncbi:MAG: aspartate/glutamate racemase family protein [Bacillota bacterium]|nr:aspartate/glutamate racemase family protein [Bacillota bacterium]
MHTVGVIRVLTTGDPEVLEAHGRLIERSFPDLRVLSRCLPDLPQGVFDQETLGIAEARMVGTAQTLLGEGAEALIVSCMMDPGVELLRKHVSVPVIGAGSAGAALALAYGGKVGLLGIMDEAPGPVGRILGAALVAIAGPAGVRTTVGLLSETGRAAVFAAAARLLEQGAEVLLFGCTGLSTIGVAPELRARFKVPVIDPVLASGLLAWYVVRRAGDPGSASARTL